MPRIIYFVEESDNNHWVDEHRVTHAFTTREAAQAACDDRAQAADTTHHMSWSVIAVELYDEFEPAIERSPEESGLCCMCSHANAVPPWTCDCVCHSARAVTAPYRTH